jgi:NADH-quinone oxidoreductase subunit J
MVEVVNLVMFTCLTITIVLLSVLAVTTGSLLRSATYLLLILICTAGLFLFLNYEFLAAAQISIYAGGVLVLFIFAIFLTTANKKVLHKKLFKRKSQIKTDIYVALIAVVGFAFLAYYLFAVGDVPMTASLGFTSDLSISAIGQTLLGTEKHQYILPFEVLSLLLFACILGGILIARKGNGSTKKNKSTT